MMEYCVWKVVHVINPSSQVFHQGHYRFEQDESLTKSATHSENAIKSI